MLTSSLSGSVTWVWSTGIRVESTHPGEEDTWHAWADALPESDDACSYVQRPILMPFSPVASYLPPLHGDMVKTQFWQLLFLSKNQTPLKTNALIPIVGNSRPGDVLIFAHRRGSTLTQYLTWFGKSPTSTRESPYYLEIEKEYKTNTWRRMISSLYSTPSYHCCNDSRAAAHGSSSSFSFLLFTSFSTLIHTLTLFCFFAAYV